MARIRACDACYKKKIQCSIRQPGAPCDWCRHHDLACTFTRERQSRKRYKFNADDIQELFSRVEQLEDALTKATSSRHPRSEASSGPGELTSPTAEDGQSFRSSSSASPGGNHPGFESTNFSPSSAPTTTATAHVPIWQALGSRSYLGQSWFYKGIAILSDEGLKWISSRTGESLTFEKFPLVCHQLRLSPPPTLLPSQLRESFRELCKLPSRDIAQRISNIFFDTSFALAFPVLDRALFQDTLEMAYTADDDASPSPPHVLAKACVLAALSVASRFDESSRDVPAVDGDMCATKAQCLLQRINGDETLVSLQTVLILQRYRTFTARWQDADTLHSVACRIVCRLGGHFYQPLKPNTPEVTMAERQVHHIRTLFWICYTLDKDISLRSGRPPLLTEDYCDLTPAEHNRSWYSPLPELDQGRSAGDSAYEKLIPHAPGQPSLSRLKERVCRMLYSTQALKSTDSEHLLHIRRLDDELEIWRSSMPPVLRPKLSMPLNLPLLAYEPSNAESMLRLNLQLEYNHLVIVIHATVRRCRANVAEAGGLPDDLHRVLHSSTDLSLEAGRSTLLILKQAVTTMITEGSHHIIFYPTVAAISLFTNILVHPADDETLPDQRLLTSAADIMHNIPLRAPSEGETRHVNQMTEFVMELARLGSCAITNARSRGEIPT